MSDIKISGWREKVRIKRSRDSIGIVKGVREKIDGSTTESAKERF